MTIKISLASLECHVWRWQVLISRQIWAWSLHGSLELWDRKPDATMCFCERLQQPLVLNRSPVLVHLISVDTQTIMPSHHRALEGFANGKLYCMLHIWKVCQSQRWHSELFSIIVFFYAHLSLLFKLLSRWSNSLMRILLVTQQKLWFNSTDIWR